jgi:hypothetical protein
MPADCKAGKPNRLEQRKRERSSKSMRMVLDYAGEFSTARNRTAFRPQTQRGSANLPLSCITLSGSALKKKIPIEISS